MLVFGDADRSAAPHAEIARIRAAMDDAAAAAPERRREPIVCAFVLASELAQGLADAEAALETAPIAALRALADLLLRPTEASFHATRGALDALAATALPERILCRRQEGFAFYGVSPEAYAASARRTPGVEAVIGVRSIGMGLAAMVAAASAAAFVTSLRPTGPPLRREARFSPEVAARLKGATGLIAVVDEGPGFSGSSFLAVVRALLELGAPLHRIVLFPSHGNPPGPGADPALLPLWRRLERRVAETEPAPWTHWPDVTGPLRRPPRDVTGGGWREARPGLEDAPAGAIWERRKFLVEGERGVFLLRFAGLGPYGAASFARAKKLAAGGFSPEMLGLRDGFTIEPWLPGRPLQPSGAARKAFLAHLADYLAFRAARLPPAPYAGASLQGLADMLCRNASLALKLDLPARAWSDRAQALGGKVRPVATDNRLHAWEWLIAADGRFIKTDAVDHCADHTLVGCQDLAWDVAGAIAEFTLAPNETEALLQDLACRDCAIDPALLAFLRPCYLAQQVGLWWFSLRQTPDGRNKDIISGLYRNYCDRLRIDLTTPAQDLH